MQFVVFITINKDAQNAPNGPDMAHIFKWDLRHRLGSNEGVQNPSEQAGPSLATGTTDSVVNAKATAKAYADFYAMEEVYIYDSEAE